MVKKLTTEQDNKRLIKRITGSAREGLSTKDTKQIKKEQRKKALQNADVFILFHPARPDLWLKKAGPQNKMIKENPAPWLK